MVWGIVTVNDVTGRKVTRSCITENAVTGTGNEREIISRVFPVFHAFFQELL
jgi:hypothetical protein